MKKLIILLLCISFFMPTVNAYAEVITAEPKEELSLGDEAEAIANMNKAITNINNSIRALGEIDLTTAQQLAGYFSTFMQVAGYAGTILGVINGSVAFMKLIGVMKDPTATALANIQKQLEVITEKITEMDKKLNNITNSMARIEAKQDFYARQHTAETLHQNWTNFTQNYMENNLNKSMTEYQSMILDGLKQWFENKTSDSRTIGDVDTNKIILLYRKDASGNYQLEYTAENSVPSNFPKDARYVVLKGDILPSSLKWNVESYLSDIESEIYSGIYRMILQKKYSDVETQNYGFPSYVDQGSKQELTKLSKDAANALIYRIASGQVNKSASFAKNLYDQFNNYINHLTAENEGIDAVIKTMYLTHPFEKDIKEDFLDLCNRMIVKTGTYGTFVSNIAGMSKFITDDEKKNIASQFAKGVNYIASGKTNGLTNDPHYSYVTNSEVYIIDYSITSSAVVNVSRPATNEWDLDSQKVNNIQTDDGGRSGSTGATFIGDTNGLLLMTYIRNEGITERNKIVERINGGNNTQYQSDQFLTSINSPESMPLDGAIQMKHMNAVGTYYTAGNGVNKAPGKADDDYIVGRQKITGSIYKVNASDISTGEVLNAIALYAEDHTGWKTCEVGAMGGPNNNDRVNVSMGSNCSANRTCEHTFRVDSTFNAIYVSPAKPQVGEGLLQGTNTSDNEYNPIESYKNLNLDDFNKTTSDKKDNSIIYYIGMGILLVFLGVVLYQLTRYKMKLSNKE